VAIKETVNEVHIARPATSSANSQFAGQVRLRSCGKRSGFFVPDMNPLNFSALSDRFKDGV
jgi:hypothetical protein